MKNEIASQIDWALPWTASVYAPNILTDGDRLLLVYHPSKISRPYDKSILKVIGDETAESFVAIVEFLGWLDFKFGKLNENVIRNSNYIKGLEPYNAYEVQNSEWLSNLKEVFQSEEETDWRKYHHYVLGFHDTRFECIAKRYSLDVYDSNTGKDIFEVVYDRMSGEEWWLKTTKTDLRCPSCKTYLGKYFYAKFCMSCGRERKTEE